MANSKRGSPIFSDRPRYFTRIRERNDYSATSNHNINKRISVYLWSIILLLISPLEAVANTTVASPSSNSSGVVNNNATMITPGLWPTNRFSQGIQCVGPSRTFSPFVTDSHSWQSPRETVTRQNIYDEDTGEVSYVQETPRFEKENFSLNFGASLQFNIPLGPNTALCHEAVRTNIEAQKLLITQTRLSIELNRLKLCTELARTGATFVGPYAVTCEGIQLDVPPGQVLPHTHTISSTEATPASLGTD